MEVLYEKYNLKLCNLTKGDLEMSAKKNLRNIEFNLSEIISQIINIDNKAVEDKLLQTQETNKLITSLDIEKVLDKIYRNVYCTKTGQPISYWSDDYIIDLIKTIGVSRTIQTIQIKSLNQVAAHWLFTDDNALENLADNDPVGYFVYAANAILVPFDPVIQLIGTEREAEARQQLYEDKITAFRQMTNIPMVTIIRINELMRRYLSITKSQAAYNHNALVEKDITIITNSLSYIEEFEQGLQNTLANLIRFEFKRGRLKSNLTYADVCDLKLHYQGYSNFRNQRRLKSMTEVEHIAFLMRDFLPDKTPLQVQFTAGVEKDTKRGVKIETHSGELTLNIKTPKTPPIKLSFSQILKKKV